jgi:glycosyltransferase involved in cell wall biosynthesis
MTLSAATTDRVSLRHMPPFDVAIVHDYLTQRGGAERVVLSLLRAFPNAPLYSSLYDPGRTFPAFQDVDVRTLPLNRLPPLRRWHRLALPLLAPAFSRLDVSADVVLCSSSGWAHGTHVSQGRKIVYCYTPARWLYQPGRYLRGGPLIGTATLASLRPYLLRWDRRAACTADRYLTSSTAVAERIRDIYGLDATVLPPPHTIDPSGPQSAIEDLKPDFHLCVSRLLPYKNIDAVAAAFDGLPEERLVVVGSGPEADSLRATAPHNVRFLGSVPDEELRWLYANSAGLVAASHEDYGLTPLEAVAFGKPAAVLRWGGFLDTVVEDVTGLFFDRPDPRLIRDAVGALRRRAWDREALEGQAARFSEEAFVARLREIVADADA